MARYGRENIAAVECIAWLRPPKRTLSHANHARWRAFQHRPAAIIRHEQAMAFNLDIEDRALATHAGIDYNDMNGIRREVGYARRNEIGSVSYVLGRNLMR